MDLLTTVPDFPIEPYAHILPKLEKAEISVKELLLLDTLEVAKRTRIPVAEVRRLTNHVLEALHRDLGLDGYQTRRRENRQVGVERRYEDADDGEDACVALQPPSLSFVSTLDPVLDHLLAGGISTGYVTEISGESGSGKTQLLLHLLLSVQLPPPHGLCKNALYVSTEAHLATNRLSQLLKEHSFLSTLPSDTQRPSLDNVLSITTVDLETQDHILSYHVPAAILRQNIGLVVIDSITANYRAESSTDNVTGLLDRAWELKKLGQLLRSLAVKHNIAIVVANQISDRLNHSDGLTWAEEPEYLLNRLAEPFPPQISTQCPESSQHMSSSLTYQSPPSHSSQLLLRQTQSPAAIAQGVTPLPPDNDYHSNNEVSHLNIRNLNSLLSFAYQQPFYTGWGDPYEPEAWKTPALGLVWTNQLGCRIILKIEDSPTVIIPNHEPESNPNPPVDSSDQHRADGEVTQSLSKEVSKNSNCFLAQGNNRSHVPGQGEDEDQEVIEKMRDNGNRVSQTCSDHGTQDQSASQLANTTLFQTPMSRRKRKMQVIFSPWTSGNSISKLESDQKAPVSGYENRSAFTLLDAAEFEILPSGIRGILFCGCPKGAA
ncbi:DNA repair protein rhp57 [Emydomyces testavorans]|uniref:DNA repair protein rhp57 n=1 Tax=Emydomyces testavorans TaxID=2070801 RepID=A0AAF0DCA1_9EURO|nr:DNA repair protein rhp57 [Emydomyces testavorans]